MSRVMHIALVRPIRNTIFDRRYSRRRRRRHLGRLVPLVVLDEVGLHGALDALAVLVAVAGGARRRRRGRRRRGRLELVGEAVGAYPADEAVLQLVDVLGRLLHHLHLHGKVDGGIVTCIAVIHSMSEKFSLLTLINLAMFLGSLKSLLPR